MQTKGLLSTSINSII